MPAAISMSLTSPAVSSQSYGVVGTSSTGFSNRLTSGASIGSYNDDIAAMSEQNRRLWVATRGTDAGFPGSPFTSSGQTVYQGAATNPAVYNTDLAEMSRQQAEMLSVQIAMQRESQMFMSISNILKTKHDTLKNTISNIR